MRINKFVVLLMLIFLLTIAPIAGAFAQDDEAETTPDAPAEVQAEETESAEVEDEVEAEETESAEVEDDEDAEDDNAGEESEDEEENAPPGTEVLILLAGLGAIVVVGGAAVSKASKNKKSA